MRFKPLTGSEEIASAYDSMATRLRRNSEQFLREVGYQGGSGRFTVHWHPGERIWALVELVPQGEAGRYWCAFGTADPSRATGLDIVCEINPPHEGINRRCAGVFVHDVSGRVYLAHSGGIGGGRPGIGKSAFVAFYRAGNWHTVLWPDRVKTRVIVIGQVDDEQLPARIASFVREVERFKNAATMKKQP